MIHRFPTFDIDEEKRELRAGGRVVVLQPRVFDLLVHLAKNRERVVSKDELLESVWPDVTVADGSLQRAVSVARRALAAGGAGNAIRTFAGRGYRLCGDGQRENVAETNARAAGANSIRAFPIAAPPRREPSAEEQRLVAAHVDVLARHELFRGARRMIAMLRHLVTEELAGRGDAVTPEATARVLNGEKSSARELAGLAVRVEAGELRERLRTYYATAGADDDVRIELPGGRFNARIFVRGAALYAREIATKQEIRFLRTADGTSLAYAISGIGRPFIKAANWLSHLEYDHESPVWKHWWRALSERFQLIRYDERGCGLSAWDVSDFSLEAWVADLEAVVERINPPPFALLGISQGAAVAIAYAVKHPERVSHLVLFGGYAQGRLKRAQTQERLDEARMLDALTRSCWGRGDQAYQKVFASLFLPNGSPEEWKNFAELQRVSCSPENAVRFTETFYQIDVVDLARQVSVPTLIMHPDRDHTIPPDQSKLLATLIPHARLVLLDGENHVLRADEPAWARFLEEIDAFI
jgi:pimeloyl-ACP methyl ester carboxylesterase/DNA-binding winged helix-turn-helix (wHTH) protein